MSAPDPLARLADVIESRKPANGGDADASYVARLLHKGPDAFLKKIGEEATEVVMAAKDVGPRRRPPQAGGRGGGPCGSTA
jgi:phosphoribosyl-ATP pyrophosphohydrolase